MSLFQGQRGYDFFKQTPIYSMTDKFVKYDEKLELVKEKGIQVYKYVHENVVDTLKENLYIIQDLSSNAFSFMMKVIKDHQPKVIDYMMSYYENVNVMIKDNWLKLDFNHDGKISFDDLKKGVQDLYDFMSNYDYIVKANEIKNNLYDEAIKFMRSDLHKADKKLALCQSNEPRNESNKQKNDWINGISRSIYI